MKLWQRHRTEVLTGAQAREYVREHVPGHAHWATAVATCSCGWLQTARHGEEAEALATGHAPARAKVA